MTSVSLEERVKQAERRAALAGDRAARNEQLLSSKMAELNKVNSHMTQQSKVRNDTTLFSPSSFGVSMYSMFS